MRPVRRCEVPRRLEASRRQRFARRLHRATSPAKAHLYMPSYVVIAHCACSVWETYSRPQVDIVTHLTHLTAASPLLAAHPALATAARHLSGPGGRGAGLWARQRFGRGTHPVPLHPCHPHRSTNRLAHGRPRGSQARCCTQTRTRSPRRCRRRRSQPDGHIRLRACGSR
jgi:hypothetical protein